MIHRTVTMLGMWQRRENEQAKNVLLPVRGLQQAAAGESKGPSACRPVQGLRYAVLGSGRKDLMQTNGNGQGALVFSTPPEVKLELALRTAISAAAAAEALGKEIGYPVRFESYDIRCMGISQYIAWTQNARMVGGAR
jgi:hypothetical protein